MVRAVKPPLACHHCGGTLSELRQEREGYAHVDERECVAELKRQREALRT